VRRREVVTPVVPIFIEKEEPGESGVIGRFLFPISGTITHASAYVNEIDPKTRAVLSVQLVYEDRGETQDFPLKVGINALARKIPISVGTRLLLQVTPGQAVHGVYVAIGFLVSEKSCRIESLPLEEIDEPDQAEG
jgi:hypothetical protein